MIQTTIVPPNENSASWDARTNNEGARTQSHLTTFETHVNAQHKDAKIIDGWFKAPASGDYKFHISADDKGRIYFD